MLAYVDTQPCIQAWPALREVVERSMRTPRPDWELPVVACQAIGGEVGNVRPAVASLACTQISIILVDDMLDNDPRGEHLRSGHGHAANMAVALQAAAFNILSENVADRERSLAAQQALARLVMQTACGQELDTADLPFNEESYWRIVAAKSTPFYASGLLLGAILGGADEQTQSGLYDLGFILGEILQIQDDLKDAFVAPANADWKGGRHNLAILYASVAEFPEKELFKRLAKDVDQASRLEEAQELLVRSGALSYCVYQLVERSRQALALLPRLKIQHQEPLRRIFDQQLWPVLKLLHRFEIPIPGQLAHLQT